MCETKTQVRVVFRSGVGLPPKTFDEDDWYVEPDYYRLILGEEAVATIEREVVAYAEQIEVVEKTDTVHVWSGLVTWSPSTAVPPNVYDRT